jgi:rubrerythrin
MLTREDYANYIKQVGDFEKEMVIVYGRLVELTSDEHIKQVCSAILKQEKEHVALVEELMNLFAVSE